MRRNRSKILITGASGFTGSHAVEMAAASGLEVISLSRSPKSRKDSQFYCCDLMDVLQVEEMIIREKPDLVLHLAGFNDAELSWKQPLQCMQINLIGTLNLLEAIRRHCPQARTLVIGSALQYTPCKNEHAPHPYSLSKTTQVMVAEEWRNLFSMDIIIAKPSNLIGPGPSNGICSKIAKEIVEAERNDRNPAFHLHNRKAQCDFVDVRDAVSAYLLILQSDTGHDRFEIGSGKSRTLGCVLDVYEKITNQPITLTCEKSIESTPVQLDLAPIESLGWNPEHSLETSLKEVLSYHKKLYWKKLN